MLQKALQIYGSGIALAVLVSFFANDETMNTEYVTIAGITGVVLAVLGLSGALMLFVAKDTGNAKSLLIAAALMAVTGLVTYLLFPYAG